MKKQEHTKQYRFLWQREIMLTVCILALGAVAGMLTDEFFQVGNLVNILNNNAIYGILGVGMTLIMATGNIDISVGAQFAVSGICTAKLAVYLEEVGQSSIWLLVLTAVGTGMALGVFNGVLVIFLRLPSVIVTLGTLSVIRGGLYLVTEGEWMTYLPRWYTSVSNISWMGVRLVTGVWILLLVLTMILFHYFKLGRVILAVGNNREYANRIGVFIPAIYLISFILWGAVIGIAAFFFVAQIGTIQPSAGNGYEMTLIAAVIIGGNKLNGGTFKALGTSIGILLLGIIGNILVLTKVPMYWQNLATGIVIISAIVVSMLADRRN